MNQIKFNDMLAAIIEASGKIDNNSNAPFTAERFIYVVMTQDLLPDKMLISEELESMRGRLGFWFSSFDVAEDKLLESIKKSTAGYLADLYMRKKLDKAKLLAIQNGQETITARDVLILIMDDPSERLKTIIEEAEEEALELAEKKRRARSDKKSNTANKSDEDEDPFELDEDLGDFDDFLKEEVLTEEELKALQKELQEKSKQKIGALVADVKRVRNELSEKVFGQDNAIHVVATGYFQALMREMQGDEKKRPRATFLFAGPPGVGKTFLAENIAKALDDIPFKRFDMSEYADKEANIEFCGSDKVYKNGKPGNVTGFVRDNQKCVLLFDEIEKAHTSVIHLFLQMLDAGILRDNYYDEKISFADAIIIMTTNAGRKLYEDSESGDFSGISRKVIINALKNDINPATGSPFFPSAICSRFASGNVVMFNHIGAHDLCAIAKKEIERNVEAFTVKTGVEVAVDDDVYTALLFSEGAGADARTISSRAGTFWNNELYELFRLMDTDAVKTDIKAVEKIKITVDTEGAKPEVAALFKNEAKTGVLVLASEESVKKCKEKLLGFDLMGSQDFDGALDIIKNKEIGFIMLDVRYGARNVQTALNAEDIDSPARDLLKFLVEQQNKIPVYLLETGNESMSPEETLSFLRQGVRGVIEFGSGTDFAKTVKSVAGSLYQHACLENLARENKLITFETVQNISKNGKNAEIRLFDLSLVVAVDSQDSESILSAASRPDVQFDEVIGAREAKAELEYFIEYLKKPKKYLGTGVKAPKGVLLYGPPGTGKTMLAKAMACKAGVTFLAAEGNQFLKQFVGEGSEAVHKLFRTARKYAPAILFIDEIDAIGKERRGAAAATSGTEETLTAFLTEMDGFVSDPSRPVFVLAATNFDVEPGGAKSLDPALMRRFDRRVYIDLPDREDRIKFLKLKRSGNAALDLSDEMIENISMRATGMSLAQLDSATELALRSAIREGSTKVTDAIFEEAFETFNNGETKKWDVAQLERVARHEAGHALLCYMSGETPSYLTIVARGNHGGYMQHAENEGKAIYTRDELLAKIRTSLGGRAAEIVYYGKRDGVSTGASGDLSSATALARSIVCTYGMDDDFGLAVTDGAMTDSQRAAINRILREQMEAAIRIVSENKEKIDRLVSALMDKNHMSAAEIEAAIANTTA